MCARIMVYYFRGFECKTFPYVLVAIIYFNSFHSNDHQSYCVPSIENPLSLGFLWL